MIVSGVECWSIGPVLLRMGLRPSLIFNNQSWLFLELNLGPLDLSFWSWAFGPSSFLIQHYVMVMSISGVGYCSFGLALLKLGLRTSFILYNKSLLFLDFDVGALDLSFWRAGRGGPGWVGWASLKLETPKCVLISLQMVKTVSHHSPMHAWFQFIRHLSRLRSRSLQTTTHQT